MGAQRCRVLLVEDEALIAMLLEDMLLELELEVVGPIAKLEDALIQAQSAKLDVAVLDINLGGDLTYIVADALSARGIPFVFATGYGAGGLPERFRSRRTLHKPFDAHELASRIREIMADASCEIANP